MDRSALFCLIMGPFKGEVPAFARLWPVRVRVRVSFTTGTVELAIIATAGLLVNSGTCTPELKSLLIIAQFLRSFVFSWCKRNIWFCGFILRLQERKNVVVNALASAG